MKYIPIKVIRNELKSYYDKHHTCTTIPAICKRLDKKNQYIVTQYTDPFPLDVININDEYFKDCFLNSLYPLDRTLEAITKDDAFSYLAENIFAIQNFFMVFLHENYAKQTFHKHDYFEITYVYSGECRMTFDNDTVKLSEGNVCIVPPGTMHEPFVLDDDSFIINLSMTKEAFEAAFAPVLLRKDLVSYYIQTILYNENQPNYLLIPSKNTRDMKNSAQKIAFESRKNSRYSFSSCISWLSVFMCELFTTYQSEITIYTDTQSPAKAEHFVMLEYIQNNFRDLTLDSLSKYTHYNKSYLSRMIQQITGRSFVDIITELKLNMGRELLESTDLSLNQIAEIIGYNTGDYFSKVYKRVYGMSAASHRLSVKSTLSSIEHLPHTSL